MKRLTVLLGFGLIALGAASCAYQEQNSIDQADARKNSVLVYGVHPDSSARQLQNKWPDKEGVPERAEKIRQKFFVKGSDGSN